MTYFFENLEKPEKNNNVCYTVLLVLPSNLIDGGSSFTARKIGQMLVDEERNRATPSVLKRKETFAGFVCLQRKPPGMLCFLYSTPSYMSDRQSVLETGRAFRAFQK